MWIITDGVAMEEGKKKKKKKKKKKETSDWSKSDLINIHKKNGGHWVSE